jgi:hypothetical protein
MGYLQTKISNLGKIWRALGWKIFGIFYYHLEYIMAIRYILRPFGNLEVICYISPRLGILCQEIMWQL